MIALESLDIFDKFIAVSKELAKLPQLVLPQYSNCSRDLYAITQELLTSNENLSRWLFKFLYFDFRQPDARTRFMELIGEYKAMKQGPEFRRLKFNCGDIANIYYRDINSKLGSWLGDQTKLSEAQAMFAMLSSADSDLVAFTYDRVISVLDAAVNKMERAVESDALNDAESARLEAKSNMRDISERLEKIGGSLSELALSFASLAKTPVTLNRS